jgi:hypothetical protein
VPWNSVPCVGMSKAHFLTLLLCLQKASAESVEKILSNSDNWENRRTIPQGKYCRQNYSGRTNLRMISWILRTVRFCVRGKVGGV